MMNNLLAQEPLEEIRSTLFFNNGKSRGPDCFTEEFFRKLCPELKDVVLQSVEQFFKGKPILKSAYHTFLILISKTSTATELADFRHIFCVKLMYKLLTMILANRMTKELIFQNQTAFKRVGKYLTTHNWNMK